MKRIAMVSLGCPKNLVDSEFICETLAKAGYAIVSDPLQADGVIVNTCSFLTSAVEESIDTLLGFIHDGKEVICTGCMVSRYGNELLKELPEVNLFAGPGTYADIVRAMQSGQRVLLPRFEGVVSRSTCTTGAFAYVKASEGCSNHCSYCLIPSIRGELVSKPLASVVDECRELSEHGVKEIILVAQDLGGYGSDRGGANTLPDLVNTISLIDGIEWIRLMYMHPATTTASIVETMVSNPKVVPYIDLPIQHISEQVLAAMGRKGGARAVWNALNLLKKKAPDIWIRTTLMLGHPGEDEKAYKELEDFIASGLIDHLGVFAYSQEEGTPSACLEDRLPPEIKQARCDRIMEIQQELSCKKLEKQLGRTLTVLVEGRHPETDLLLIGRAAFQAPEIDGHVIINDGSAAFGSFSPVEITETMEYDLVGRIV